MNAEKAAKRSTNGHGAASAPETQASHTPSSAADAAAPAKSRSLKPLLGLAHFVARYKGKLILAGLGLVLAASATLALPIAVRQVIDHGFSGGDPAYVNRAFLTLFAI